MRYCLGTLVLFPNMKTATDQTACDKGEEISDTFFRHLLDLRVPWRQRSKIIDDILLNPTIADLRYDVKHRRPC